MIRIAVLLILSVAATASAVGQDRTTEQETRAGMKCGPNSGGDMECDYHVGRSLHFGIVGVGKADASIYFYAASFEGDYFAVIGLLHGCVIVRPGQATSQARRADFAFVSPRNGQVYSRWETCRDAK